ncbi:hypothetical protein [Paenibacillus jilunlii]|uniref:Uncharacterized protein n=1 Tax=Paenibacillus jilunlii TaxID=682956 RepID=A0A1H0A193_9BACL|nr:hypothetical protein [Paenibacillus jilunlii]KWX79943.1 hypothetical protein AML91_01880 [Paenibacillus jilunlii]SDN27479.1 hypothetical protein SAMN05216191_13434 [Paenibacillus jilunlii]
MNIDVNKVGKRWFICKGDGIDVEATYSHWVDWKNGWKTKRKWTITGKGSKKYRTEIIEQAEKQMNPFHS